MLIGGFLGDYVKGRLNGQFDAQVERGIRLHRAIDQFTDQHDIVRRSQQRFDPRFRRYAGIMTDIIYDHLLAKRFSHYTANDLGAFSTRVLQTLVDHDHLLTEPAATTARRMYQLNSLAGYNKEDFVERSLVYISQRLTRANPLDEAYAECQQHLVDLGDDLSEFYPVLTDYCDTWKKTH